MRAGLLGPRRWALVSRGRCSVASLQTSAASDTPPLPPPRQMRSPDTCRQSRCSPAVAAVGAATAAQQPVHTAPACRCSRAAAEAVASAAAAELTARQRPPLARAGHPAPPPASLLAAAIPNCPPTPPPPLGSPRLRGWPPPQLLPRHTRVRRGAGLRRQPGFQGRRAGQRGRRRGRPSQGCDGREEGRRRTDRRSQIGRQLRL